ncbi:MAG: metallopeptidase TldD-related protein [Candidatus Andeanibacterium colombiense]|uniref:Metallopeptidase TldD-related protein n=1 Tax=Candidatus Andeanibacterium colombiense TaxID=3121345 RepID=A0AAJ5X5V0_9SPHN|nr:MAG: metallopeptidase TldD-related protein [Sphingomonadaceae bacterium]
MLEESQEIDWQIAETALNEALHGADDGELFYAAGRGENFGWREGRLQSAGYNSGNGFGIRVVAGERTGFAHSSNLAPDAIRRAADAAALSKRGHEGVLAIAPPRTNSRLYGDRDMLETQAFTDKSDFLGRVDAYLRAKDPRIEHVNIGLNGDFGEVIILRPGGERFTDPRPMCQLNIGVTVEQGGVRETGTAAFGGRYGYERLMHDDTWKKFADEALRVALLNLDAIAGPSGEMDVVIGPGWNGVMIHEAVGHGLEGDFNRKNQSTYSGKIGERVAAPGVTIVDNGSIPESRGSLTIDDEGTPSQRTVLIEDGILKGYMQDRLNARLMGVASTGNGRRQTYAHIPMPRMTNTYLEGGDRDPGEILASLKRGLYVANMAGGQVDITNGKFVFQCTEAYLVEDGKIVAPVKKATLIGDGPRAMRNVAMIGNDFALDPGLGVCGKNGQSVPAGLGQPTVKIAGMTVGGSAD